MLVLTRKKNQSLMLGSEIEVQVLEIQGEQVKLGIKAPKNLRILRQEIFLDVEKQNKLAAGEANSLEVLEQVKKLQKEFKK
jgi:carbon storage regulator